MASRILVTGGAGFIGSAVCRHLIARDRTSTVVNVDKLTYAANPRRRWRRSRGNPRYAFVQADICDRGRAATRSSRASGRTR